MLRIACPFCDTRDETEFHCGGDAHIERPKPDVNDTEWADYLFKSRQSKGIALRAMVSCFRLRAVVQYCKKHVYS